MPRVAYIAKNFTNSTISLISRANLIIEEYSQQGFSLTLRQLYYQFVARDLLANKQSEYDRLGRIISDARLAGLVDWRAIEDRTRFLRRNSHWDDPAAIIASAAGSFAIDKWQSQENYVEVWIEKDALVGVIEPVCRNFDVPYFSCRGYTSQSEMWRAARRFIKQAEAGKHIHVLHLGDHDPSGIDMTRDVKERINLFTRLEDTDVTFSVNRLALNMPQVELHKPPPNPAKLSDSRAKEYIAKHGRSSWELDALDPVTLSELIEQEINSLIEREAWQAATELEAEHINTLRIASNNWSEVVTFLGGGAIDG